jgi:type I restriction enzyme, S subunit
VSLEQIKLADICSFKTGKLNSNAAVEGGKFPFFTCAQETYWINKAAFDTEAVLLGGNNANGVYPLKYYKGEFNAYQRTYIIETLDEKKLITRFLYYALRPALAQFQAMSIGAATQYLTKTILDNFKIGLPAVQVQEKVVEILSHYDDLIENNRRRIQLLEESARLLYKEWFVQLRFPGHEHVKIVDGVPEGWNKQPIKDVLTLNYGKALKADLRIPGECPVYGSSGAVGSHNKALVKAPGIIVGRKGNVGSIYWVSKDYWPIDTVYYVNSGQSSLFLYHALQKVPFINTDVAVPGLNRDMAYSREILTPAETILSLFHDEVEPIQKQIEQLFEYNYKLAQARDLLLPRLMNGTLTV